MNRTWSWQPRGVAEQVLQRDVVGAIDAVEDMQTAGHLGKLGTS